MYPVDMYSKNTLTYEAKLQDYFRYSDRKKLDQLKLCFGPLWLITTNYFQNPVLSVFDSYFFRSSPWLNLIMQGIVHIAKLYIRPHSQSTVKLKPMQL